MQTIRIHPSRILRTLERTPIGINNNHFMDGTLLPFRRPLCEAIREMGVGYARFPGGEKSDDYLWSVPPFGRPCPTFARYGADGIRGAFLPFAGQDGRTIVPEAMDFDAYLRLCGETNAEPVVVLPYDSIYRKAVPGETIPEREELLETGEAWVAYARRQAEEFGMPRVRYWELGNESYHRGSVGRATAEQYAADIAEWSVRMKKADPSILIGANGPNGVTTRGDADPENAEPWWQTVLERSVRHIDFLAIHDYPCWKWGGYGYYLRNEPTFHEAVDQAVECLDAYCSPDDARRIGIAITEMNSTDWDGHPEDHGWKHINTLGHALVLADMLGRYRAHPRLDFALLWNTRWVNNLSAAPPQLWDSLQPDNALNATGMAMALWAGVEGDRMCHVEGPSHVPAFATTDGQRIWVVLIRKVGDTGEITLNVADPAGNWSIRSVAVLTGRDPEDTRPTLVTAAGDGREPGRVTLAPYSATRVELSR